MGWRNPRVNDTGWAGVGVGVRKLVPQQNPYPRCGSGVHLEGKKCILLHIQTDSLIGIYCNFTENILHDVSGYRISCF